MRLFVAAELPQEMHEALCETSALLREVVNGRYVPPTNFHMTLAFLGEVPGSQVDAASHALDEACLGVWPIEVAFGPLGSFGRPRRATLWQGFSRGVDELGGLAGDIREYLTEAGLPFDETAFVPHITLMRNAEISRGRLPMPFAAKGIIDTITLFSSDLSGERPHYEPLYQVKLRSDPAGYDVAGYDKPVFL